MSYPRKDHPCAGCVHATQNILAIGGLECDYLLTTGRARQKICGSGELCTVKAYTMPERKMERYDAGGYVVRTGPRPGPKERLKIDEIRRLASMGQTDQMIADELGCSKGAVFKARQRYSIPPGRAPGWQRKKK